MFSFCPVCVCVCVHSVVCVCARMHSEDSVTGVSSPCQFRESKAVF